MVKYIQEEVGEAGGSMSRAGQQPTMNCFTITYHNMERI